MINYFSQDFKSGFAAVVGKPNVGKSSLVNHIVGKKVAIVSSKPQTTRHRVLGVKNYNKAQIVFVDTPGIHNPEHELGKFMEKTYLGEMKDADIVLFIADSTHDIRDEDEIALKHLFSGKKQPNAPIFLVMNKIDISDPEKLKTREQVFLSKGKFAKVFHVSALTGEGVEEMENQLNALLPPGPPYFPPGQDSDQSQEFQISEIVREKVLEKTRQEIPHCVFVHTEEIREGETPDITYIRAIVYVERKSQKGIIIGKNGSMLKDIGTLARQELEPLLGTKVFLDLWVKIKDDWRDRKDLLKSWGYEI
ncbi:MAG: GTPase Era [Firmicutes bacterium]|nr:GTPase Era [Bacillota bacterium]